LTFFFAGAEVDADGAALLAMLCTVMRMY
jgi:hypothetical protein